MDGTTDTLTSLVALQATISGVIVYGLDALKRARWFPWLTAETETVNRWVALGLAVIAAIGIHWDYDATAGVMTITGLSIQSIAAHLAHGVMDIARSWVFQQVIFDVKTSKAIVLQQPNGGQ
jgi:hypothetical protein